MHETELHWCKDGFNFFPSPLPSTTPCPINPSGYLGKIPKLSSPFQLFKSQESLQCHLKLNLNLVSSSTSSAEWSWDPDWEQGEMEGDPQPGEDTCSHPLVDSVLCEWQSRGRGVSSLPWPQLSRSHANCTQISSPVFTWSSTIDRRIPYVLLINISERGTERMKPELWSLVASCATLGTLLHLSELHFSHKILAANMHWTLFPCQVMLNG